MRARILGSIDTPRYRSVRLDCHHMELSDRRAPVLPYYVGLPESVFYLLTVLSDVSATVDSRVHDDYVSHARSPKKQR